METVGPLSTMFVYNDATNHVTGFWPPDWLPLHTGNIPWKASLFGFPQCNWMAAGHLMEKLVAKWSCPLGNSWFSHVGHFIHSITLLCRVRASNLIFHLL